MATHRIEQDSMGPVSIAADRLWGASTQRALDNLPLHGAVMPSAVIHALARIKAAAAQQNRVLGLIPPELAELIRRACDDISAGRLDAHFPLDCFQTGSGTSTNMNVNEVVANRAAQLAGLPVGLKTPVHPNDHVNRGQSSNDTFPSAMHIAAVVLISTRLVPDLTALVSALEAKAAAFSEVIKIGRTHLQDATPITLGQEFSGYAEQVRRSAMRAGEAAVLLAELPLGGTAVGTGINAPPGFAAAVCADLAQTLGLPLHEAANHFEASGSRDGVVAASGRLKTIAVSLSRIVSDIRLLGSGPRLGLGEIILPALQPGSSIMPGKVNPIVCEAVMQVCMQVMGHDLTISLAGFGGAGSLLELNVAMPVMAHALIESIELLAAAARVLREKCILGIEPDRERCAAAVERSLAMATALVPIVGYDRATKLASQAAREGRSVREVALAAGILPPAELATALDPALMLKPGFSAAGE